MNLRDFLYARLAEDDEAATGSGAHEPDEGWMRTTASIRSVVDVLTDDLPITNPILRRLAVPYAHHPDYQDAWRP